LKSEKHTRIDMTQKGFARRRRWNLVMEIKTDQR
jgi:hypothetical protein